MKTLLRFIVCFMMLSIPGAGRAQSQITETAGLTYIPGSSIFFLALQGTARSAQGALFDGPFEPPGVYGGIADSEGQDASFNILGQADIANFNDYMLGLNTGCAVIASYFAIPGTASAQYGAGGVNSVAVGLPTGSSITDVTSVVGHATVSAMTMGPNAGAFASVDVGNSAGEFNAGSVTVGFGAAVLNETQIVNGTNVSTTTIIPASTSAIIYPTFNLSIGDQITNSNWCGSPGNVVSNGGIIESCGSMCDVYVIVTGT